MLRSLLILVYACVLSGWAAEQQSSATNSKETHEFNRLQGSEDQSRSYVQSGYNSPAGGARIVTLRNGARALIRGNPPLETAQTTRPELPVRTVQSSTLNVALPQRQATHHFPISTLPYNEIGTNDYHHRYQLERPGIPYDGYRPLPLYGRDYGIPHRYGHPFSHPYHYGRGFYGHDIYEMDYYNPYLYRQSIYRRRPYDLDYYDPYHRINLYGDPNSYRGYYDRRFYDQYQDDYQLGFARGVPGYGRNYGGYSQYYNGQYSNGQYANGQYSNSQYDGYNPYYAGNNAQYSNSQYASMPRGSVYPSSIQDQLDSTNSNYRQNAENGAQQQYTRDYSTRSQTAY